VVLYSLSLRQITFPPSLTFFHYFFHLKPPLHIFLSFPLYRYIPCSNLYSYPVTSRIFRDIFLSFIGFLPSLILKFWLLKVFVLFRLTHIDSMRQRLGGNPLINAEVKIFNLLVCSGSFPWFQAPSGIYTWIICAPCFG